MGSRKTLPNFKSHRVQAIPRIISLIASATEIVCALGLKDQLVGRAHECDYPAFVKKLPICAELNFNASGSSREIDQQVKDHVKNGHALYKVNAELIEKLNPEIIITQSHCEVCAVTAKDVEKALGQKMNIDPKIVSLQPNSLEDLYVSIRKIAEASRVPKRGEQQVRRIQKGMEAIRTVAESCDDKPTVAAIEWLDPLMAAGNWVPELVSMAGGRNLFGKAGKHSPWMTWEGLVEKNPDIILVLPCGFDLARTRDEMSVLSSKKEWHNLNAVLNNRVFLLDGNQYFNRPGPRLLESLEICAEIFHPDLFRFGHQNEAWEYYGFGG